MTAINAIDYNKLADIEASTGIPFDKLCERAERGENVMGRSVRAPDENWLSYEQAAKFLCCTTSALQGAFTHKDMEEDYWGVQWVTRSKNKAFGRRGCGVLFCKNDLKLVKNIQQATHVQLLTALRVNQAMFMGKI